MNSQHQQQITEQQAKMLLDCIPQRPSYDIWIKTISAIGNTFDEATALSLLLSRFVDEAPNEHQKKIQKRLKHITIATLIYTAKEFGCNLKNVFNGTQYIQPYQTIKRTIKSPQKRFIGLKKEILRKLVMPNDEALPEYIKFMINEFKSDGFSDDEARRIVLNNADFLKQEQRCYTVAVNRSILNKNLNPLTMMKHPNYTNLTNNFENSLLTKDEVINAILQGWALVFAEMITDEAGKIKRESASFNRTNIFGIDIDSGLSIQDALEIPETKQALILYTTNSHTDELHKFRIIFGIDAVIRSGEALTDFIKHFISIYKADHCSDRCRVFYGNTNAIVYDIESGEVFGGGQCQSA